MQSGLAGVARSVARQKRPILFLRQLCYVVERGQHQINQLQVAAAEQIEQEKFAMRSYFVLAVGFGVMLTGGLYRTARAAETLKVQNQEVTGTVNDALGRPIPSAAVTLQDAQGKTAAKTISDSQGHFILKAVAPGVYAVVGNKKDFKPATAILSVTKTGFSPAPTHFFAQASWEAFAPLAPHLESLTHPFQLWSLATASTVMEQT